MKSALSLMLALLLGATGSRASTLYEQALASLLEKRFNSPDISFVFLEAQGGGVVAERWDASDQPVPLGSLVKPFAALAYGPRHGFRYPTRLCRGAADGCWLPRGHGRINMTQAIAFSCNAYFRSLAADVKPADVTPVLRAFELEDPGTGAPAQALMGLGGEWKIPPRQMVRAYCRLARQATEPGVADLLRGMALSAQEGTGSGVQTPRARGAILAKTGTAPCVHLQRAPGDGYVIVLYPAESPRWALLVRVHGVPGARAAIVGGQILQAAIEGK
jgi:cell division protein FtsI/penicillin-binding protein 2